uniref:Detected protein of confused Function n=1 Tax=Panagrellus redivivus TaxID=6233 RepID=A0A7E5A0R6_PANRE
MKSMGETLDMAWRCCGYCAAASQQRNDGRDLVMNGGTLNMFSRRYATKADLLCFCNGQDVVFWEEYWMWQGKFSGLDDQHHLRPLNVEYEVGDFRYSADARCMKAAKNKPHRDRQKAESVTER